jgi:hypothetical protein
VKCRLPAASVHPAEDSRIDFRRLDEGAVPIVVGIR